MTTQQKYTHLTQQIAAEEKLQETYQLLEIVLRDIENKLARMLKGGETTK